MYFNNLVILNIGLILFLLKFIPFKTIKKNQEV
jgi:hypothetical protein